MESLDAGRPVEQNDAEGKVTAKITRRIASPRHIEEPQHYPDGCDILRENAGSTSAESNHTAHPLLVFDGPLFDWSQQPATAGRIDRAF